MRERLRLRRSVVEDGTAYPDITVRLRQGLSIQDGAPEGDAGRLGTVVGLVLMDMELADHVIDHRFPVVQLLVNLVHGRLLSRARSGFPRWIQHNGCYAVFAPRQLRRFVTASVMYNISETRNKR